MKLGSIRDRAMTLAKVADVLRVRGDYEAALRIYLDEALPTFERLGRPHDLVHVQAKVAQLYLARDAADDRERAAGHLAVALREADRLRIPAADWIRGLLAEHGLTEHDLPAPPEHSD